MLRLHYQPFQPAFPCKFDLDSDHECTVSFGDLHAIVYLKSPDLGLFIDVPSETLNNDRFTIASVTPRRDPEGQLKATLLLSSMPKGVQHNQEGGKELMLTLLAGRRGPGAVLTVLAHFQITLLVNSIYQNPLTTTVRFDMGTFSMVEDNAIVILPCTPKPAQIPVNTGSRASAKARAKKLMHQPYRQQLDKSPPSVIECANLSEVFEDGDVILPIRR